MGIQRKARGVSFVELSGGGTGTDHCHSAAGAGEAAKSSGRKERDLLSSQSEAYRKEQEIKGKADAEATGIYASAYNSSPSAADFYQFVKTLETYQKSLSKDTTAVFTTNSDLFRLLKHIEPAK